MKYAVTTLALALALAGCNSGGSTESADADGDGKVSLNEAKDAAEKSGMKPKPGKYKVTSDMGGMKVNAEFCLTQEEADAGFEGMLTEGQEGECEFEKYEISGSDIDATAVCKTPMGDMRMSMVGEVTETSSDIEMNMKGKAAGVDMDMTIKMKQERIGDCDGTETPTVAP